jgi:hypothetical protein
MLLQRDIEPTALGNYGGYREIRLLKATKNRTAFSITIGILSNEQ